VQSYAFRQAFLRKRIGLRNAAEGREGGFLLSAADPEKRCVSETASLR